MIILHKVFLYVIHHSTEYSKRKGFFTAMVLETFFLVSALCLDMWVAGIAYGTENIHISFHQTVLINSICSGCLGISLLLGTWIDSQISESFTKGICFISLLIIGFYKLLHSYIQSYIIKHTDLHKEINFSVFDLKCILNVYADPVYADTDQNKHLSWKEAILFSLAMSLDSLIAGTLAAFMKIPIRFAVILSFCIGELFLYLGIFIGRKITRYTNLSFSWLGGGLFLFLAFWKMR